MTTKSDTTSDFGKALNIFRNKVQEQINQHFAARLPNLRPDVLVLDDGVKFIRVVKQRQDGGGRSAFCFVAKQDGQTKQLGAYKKGDIFKTASWKQPAKHVRGSIFSEDFAGYGVNTYGANYL